jgi:hypothetical protein
MANCNQVNCANVATVKCIMCKYNTVTINNGNNFDMYKAVSPLNSKMRRIMQSSFVQGIFFVGGMIWGLLKILCSIIGWLVLLESIYCLYKGLYLQAFYFLIFGMFVIYIDDKGGDK